MILLVGRMLLRWGAVPSAPVPPVPVTPTPEYGVVSGSSAATVRSLARGRVGGIFPPPIRTAMFER